ncbi:MAG TPA: AtpZ/AtpI family protein [Methylovirgula sp.]
MSGNEQKDSRDADSDAALRARLEKLSHTLDAHRGETGPEGDDGPAGSGSSWGAATNLGFQAMVEFVTAVIVGPIIGWQIDSWFKTKPIFFIVFLFVGLAAGLLNVYRLAMGPPGRRGNSK